MEGQWEVTAVCDEVIWSEKNLGPIILATLGKLGDILDEFEHVIVHLSSTLASFGQIKIIFCVFYTSGILIKNVKLFLA